MKLKFRQIIHMNMDYLMPNEEMILTAYCVELLSRKRFGTTRRTKCYHSFKVENI